jgi:hypothetical protein
MIEYKGEMLLEKVQQKLSSVLLSSQKRQLNLLLKETYFTQNGFSFDANSSFPATLARSHRLSVRFA